MEWETRAKSFYLGENNKEFYASLDNEYGFGKWRIAYVLGDNIFSKNEIPLIFEDAYYEFFRKNPDALNSLIKTACNVYENIEDDLIAGFTYPNQESLTSHVYDVAIRRALFKIGRSFNGDHLICIGDKEEGEGYKFNPGVVPFHMPENICKNEIVNYSGKSFPWYDQTILDFESRNNLLQILITP